MTYSTDGIFISVAGFCGSNGENGFLTALYAFPKKVLYTRPAGNNSVVVHRATYLPSTGWYRSLPTKDQMLNFDPDSSAIFNPFNTFVLPSRPQAKEDAFDPFFVIGKVSIRG